MIIGNSGLDRGINDGDLTLQWWLIDLWQRESLDNGIFLCTAKYYYSIISSICPWGLESVFNFSAI